MLLSVGVILIVGLLLGWLCKLIKIPSLVGYLLVGVILGPFVLGFLDIKLLNISAELRQVALAVILLRAGLSLKISDLKKIGRPAILLCFLPALLEIVTITLFAPIIFHISYLEAGILGCVLGAVSPAVIVPRMVKMMEKNQGVAKGVPQMILAGASMDDVFAIVIFTALMSIATIGKVDTWGIVSVPISLIIGSITGIVIGIILSIIFHRINIRCTMKVIIFMAIALIMLAIENLKVFPFSGLLGILALGMTVLKKNEVVAIEVGARFGKLWIVAEIFLFVLVGASVDISYFINNLGFAIIVIMVGLLLRMIGVFVSVMRTNLNGKERLFCAISSTPKATVQAAICGIPLAMGLACGELVLSVAVVAILFTAPLGAYAMDMTHNKLIKIDL